MDWVHLSQETEHWPDVLNAVMYLVTCLCVYEVKFFS